RRRDGRRATERAAVARHLLYRASGRYGGGRHGGLALRFLIHDAEPVVIVGQRDFGRAQQREVFHLVGGSLRLADERDAITIVRKTAFRVRTESRTFTTYIRIRGAARA